MSPRRRRDKGHLVGWSAGEIWFGRLEIARKHTVLLRLVGLVGLVAALWRVNRKVGENGTVYKILAFFLYL
jgi:hypothetical protein